MKIVKILLILVITLFSVFISLAELRSATNPYISLTILAAVYCLLIYLIWPIGTPRPEVAYKRFFIVLGVGAFIVAYNVLATYECPGYPINPFVPNYQGGIVVIVLFACAYLGKLPTALLIALFGGRLIYLGYTKKIDPKLLSKVGLNP